MTYKEKTGYCSFKYENTLKVDTLYHQEEDYFLGNYYDNNNHIKGIHFYTETIERLLKDLQTIKYNHLITFVPNEHQKKFEGIGYDTFAYWQDFFSYDVKDYNVELVEYCEDDRRDIETIMNACKYQTRGFASGGIKWIDKWLNGEDDGLIISKGENPKVFVYRDDIVKGYIALATYNETLWIREIAVDPKYQNSGIGSKLLKMAMTYGCKMKKAFLMADQCNDSGLALYKKFGFEAGEDGQLDMVMITSETHLDHYLNQSVYVVIDRPLGSKHPKFDMIYPINYGYLPHTKSGDDMEVDAYVIGPSTAINDFEGQVIALIRRRDDQEEKLVVADQYYDKATIEKAVAFTEQYFDSEIIML